LVTAHTTPSSPQELEDCRCPAPQGGSTINLTGDRHISARFFVSSRPGFVGAPEQRLRLWLRFQNAFADCVAEPSPTTKAGASTPSTVALAVDKIRHQVSTTGSPRWLRVSRPSIPVSTRGADHERRRWRNLALHGWPEQISIPRYRADCFVRRTSHCRDGKHAPMNLTHRMFSPPRHPRREEFRANSASHRCLDAIPRASSRLAASGRPGGDRGDLLSSTSSIRTAHSRASPRFRDGDPVNRLVEQRLSRRLTPKELLRTRRGRSRRTHAVTGTAARRTSPRHR